MPTDKSQHADPIIALGERIVAELGDPRTNSTLARWLAHHAARLIQAADKARESGDPDASGRDAEAREAILQLWEARTTWPGGWPPPRAAEIARLLDDLPGLDDDTGWYRQTVLARLQDLHYHVLAAIVDLATNDGGADVEQGWLSTFGDRLTSDETSLLRRAVGRPRRLQSRLQWWENYGPDDQIETTAAENDAGNAAPGTHVHPLLDLADAYQTTISDLFQRATGTKDDEIDADKRTANGEPDE